MNLGKFRMRTVLAKYGVIFNEICIYSYRIIFTRLNLNLVIHFFTVSKIRNKMKMKITIHTVNWTNLEVRYKYMSFYFYIQKIEMFTFKILL